MYANFGARWKSAFVFVLALASLLSIYGCPLSPGGDDGDGPPPPPPPSRKTPSELLTSYFEQAYAERDSILYDAMLDEEFQFEFLVADRDSVDLDGEGWWSRRSDLLSTGNMFRAEEVTDVDLDIFVQSDNPYLGEDCDGCRQLETNVLLRVTTTELSGPQQTPLVYAVNSPQRFVVKKDADDATQWVIWRQFDREGTRKTALGL